MVCAKDTDKVLQMVVHSILDDRFPNDFAIVISKIQLKQFILCMKFS